jgi:hypothetical protein
VRGARVRLVWALDRLCASSAANSFANASPSRRVAQLLVPSYACMQSCGDEKTSLILDVVINGMVNVVTCRVNKATRSKIRSFDG